MNKIFLCFLVVFGWQSAFAKVDISSVCYIQFKPHASRLAVLKFRTYFDDEIKKYVGGLVVYSKSTSLIQLTYAGEESRSVPGMNVSEYKRSWLEILDGKVTGRYIEVGTDLGNQSGRSIDYINYRTQATTSFSFSSNACGD